MTILIRPAVSLLHISNFHSSHLHEWIHKWWATCCRCSLRLNTSVSCLWLYKNQDIQSRLWLWRWLQLFNLSCACGSGFPQIFCAFIDWQQRYCCSFFLCSVLLSPLLQSQLVLMILDDSCRLFCTALWTVTQLKPKVWADLGASWSMILIISCPNKTNIWHLKVTSVTETAWWSHSVVYCEVWKRLERN